MIMLSSQQWQAYVPSQRGTVMVWRTASAPMGAGNPRSVTLWTISHFLDCPRSLTQQRSHLKTLLPAAAQNQHQLLAEAQKHHLAQIPPRWPTLWGPGGSTQMSAEHRSIPMEPGGLDPARGLLTASGISTWV